VVHSPPREAAPATDATPLAAATAALNAWVEVDLHALEANLHALQARLGPQVEIIAVVKANAYGAGLAGVSRALEGAGVPRFAVVWLPEALELRQAGVRAPVIVLGRTHPERATEAVEHDITLTCDSLAVAEALSRAAVAAGRSARVHVHVDTGLHRDGVTPAEALALAPRLRELPGLVVEGLSTHMANADEDDDSFSDEQLAVFRPLLEALSWIPYRHTANSATALRRAGFRFDGVRVGLALHGILPENTPDPGVHPILSVKAHVARVLDVAPGEGVSYGLEWRAARPSRMALVPVGYADGWRRSLGGKGEVLIHGRRCPMAGRVCMDQFLVDVTDVPGVTVGDEAVLLGAQGNERITAEEVARLAGTIPWDTVSSLLPRLPRFHHRGGVLEPHR
jgi:alanine racemase